MLLFFFLKNGANVPLWAIFSQKMNAKIKPQNINKRIKNNLNNYYIIYLASAWTVSEQREGEGAMTTMG